MERADVVVVGGGIVGAAVARRFSQQGREVLVLEAEAALGQHATSRNSEVIHAGLYYPSGSLKARLCVGGRRLLRAYCDDSGVSHRRTGKLVVANGAEQLVALQALQQRAERNGVDDLSWLSAEEVRRVEPEVRCDAALFSPSTGIIDSHGLLQRLKTDAVAGGAIFLTQSPLLGATITDSGVRLRVGGTEEALLECGLLVNAAGLWASSVAHLVGGYPAARIPETHLAKGHYYRLLGKSGFSHLIYPMPVPGGLGVHITLDLGGGVRLGPDVEWVDSVDYAFHDDRRAQFAAAARSYFPALTTERLEPDTVGIRAKLSGPGEQPADFVIEGPLDHGFPVVQMFGIESPGLTACLAIADYAASRVSASG